MSMKSIYCFVCLYSGFNSVYSSKVRKYDLPYRED